MIAVFIEVHNGQAKRSSLEVLSEAARLARPDGSRVTALFAGGGPAAEAGEAFRFGAAEAIYLESPALAAYSAQGYALAVAGWLEESGPDLVLFAATALGKDLAPRVAALLDVGLVSDCTCLRKGRDGFEFVRPAYGGKVLLTLTMNRRPALAALRPNVFKLEGQDQAGGQVVVKKIGIPAGAIKGMVTGIENAGGAELDISEADVVIAGGRGMKESANFALLEELASLFPRAAVGASRSAVDSGWIGHQHQIGQTGKIVSPALYMAFGISGAMQHLAGMSSSRCIVAVNKDPEAPIFKAADYGIIGDLFEIIPRLKEELGHSSDYGRKGSPPV